MIVFLSVCFNLLSLCSIQVYGVITCQLPLLSDRPIWIYYIFFEKSDTESFLSMTVVMEINVCLFSSSSVRQKCHALYIDETINSERQLLENLYQLFLFAVFKLHAYIQKLPYNQRAESNTTYFIGKSSFLLINLFALNLLNFQNGLNPYLI